MLTDNERVERRRISNRKYKSANKERISKQGKEYYQANKERILKRDSEYYQANKEKIRKQGKEYYQTPRGYKQNTLSKWKSSGLKESPENLERIYGLWLTQECCNACECVLIRDGLQCSKSACMDHNHTTYRFRHIICRSCNSHDNWKKYFC